MFDIGPFLYLRSFKNICLLCKIIGKARGCSQTREKESAKEVREGWTQMLQGL